MHNGWGMYLFAGDATDNALYQVPQLQSLSRLPRCSLEVGCFRSQTKPQAPCVMINADDPGNNYLCRGKALQDAVRYSQADVIVSTFPERAIWLMLMVRCCNATLLQPHQAIARTVA